MEIKTEAIVLQTIDYKDNDKLLTLFSPTLGKITAGIRGVKKPKSKLAFSAQPFCFAEYVLAEKGGRYTVTNAYLHESFFDLRTDIVRFYFACAMAEVCQTLIMENESYEGLFIAFINGLKELCLAGVDEAESFLSFALMALHESGFTIDLGYLEECDGDVGDSIWFDFSDGRFGTLERLQEGQRASVSTYFTLRKCAGLTYDCERIKGGKKRALRLIKAYLYEKMEVDCDNLGECIRLMEEE